MRVVIDSSALFSMFFEEDKFHSEGKSVLKRIIMKDLEPIIPTLAVLEVCGAMRRKSKDHRLAEIVEDKMNFWIDSETFSVKELDVQRMKFSTEEAIRFGLRGADAVFVSLAKELGAELLTFDDEVRKKIRGKIKLFDVK